MRTSKLIFTLLLLMAVCLITVPKSRGGDNTLYSMQITYVSAATGEFSGTYDMNLQTASQLKASAAGASSTSLTVLIGTGSGGPGEPVTDIQIVGIAGVAYGEVTICRPPEEEE